MDDGEGRPGVRVRQTGRVTAPQRMQERGLVDVAQLGEVLGQVELGRVGFDHLIFVDDQDLAGAVQLEPHLALGVARLGWQETRPREAVAVLQPDAVRLDPRLLSRQLVVRFRLQNIKRQYYGRE